MTRIPAYWVAGMVLAAALGTAEAIPGRRAAPSAVAPSDTAITSRSIAFFERRLAADPHNYMIAGRLANRYVLRFGTGANMADVARAEAIARDLVGSGPDRGQALSRLAGVLLMQHKFAASRAAAAAALELNVEDPDAIGAVFDASLAMGQYAEAESALARLKPGTLGAQVRRAQWLDAQGKTEAAFDAFDRICRQFVRSSGRPAVVAWCLTQLGAVEHARSGPEAAEAMWEGALAAQPGYRGAIEGLAGLAAARGQWARAGQLLRRIAADAHPDLYLREAEVATASGDTSLAREAEARFLAVAGRPENEALFGEVLALFYLERRDLWSRDSALALAERDVKRRPTIESFDVLSWVRFRRGELGAALAASNRARRWGSGSPTIEYHRARILAALGQERAAAALLRRALASRTLLAPHARIDLERRARGIAVATASPIRR
jgi:tetratricopeptide (TPR) repeat protein